MEVELQHKGSGPGTAQPKTGRDIDVTGPQVMMKQLE